MIRVRALKAAADEFVATAILGEGWEQALTCLAEAAGAGGASLMCNHGHRLAAAICTPSIAEPAREFLAGRTPPLSRQVRVSGGLHLGFRVDHDDFTPDALQADPYYQEFLRPRGYFWHANITIARDGSDLVDLSFKRRLADGPYEPGEVALLNAITGELRMAARLARRMFDAKASGVVELLHHRGDPVFELDALGRVLRTHAFDDTTSTPVRVACGRLVVSDAIAQRSLDRAVMQTTRGSQPAALVALPGNGSLHCALQVVRVAGRARDIFVATTAVAVLVRLPGKRSYRNPERALFRDAFMLTDREADVAVLLCEGVSIEGMARQLGIQVATLRSYLKGVFEKTGTSRQAELAALLGRLRL